MSTPRRLVIAFLVFLLLAGVAVALLPRFVTAGLGHGLLRERLGAAVSGGADFDAVTASWSGEQRIDGLVLTADDGVTRVAVDVVVRHGLIDLVGGLPPVLDVSLAGTASGRVDASGRPSFLRLPAGAATGTPTPGGGDGGRGGASDGGRLPAGLRLAVDGLVVDLSVPAGDGDRPLRLTDLRGRIEVVPGEPVAVQLASPTVFDGVDGSLDIDLAARDLVAADGRLTPLAVTIESATVQARGVPLPTSASAPAVLVDRLDLTADGRPDGRLTASFAADARVDGAAGPSRLVAEVDIDGLVRDGRLDLAGAAWSADADGTDVPTAVLQGLVPALAEQGIDLGRDLGPTVAVQVNGGSTAGEVFSVSVRGAAATLEAGGTTAEAGRIAVDRAVLEAAVRPALLARHVPATLDAAVPMRIETDAFVIDPAALADGRLPAMRIMARSQADAPFTVTLDQAADAAGDPGVAPTSVRIDGIEAMLLPPGAVTGAATDATDAAGRSATVSLRGVELAHPAIATPLRTSALVVRGLQRAMPPIDGGPLDGWIDLRLEPAVLVGDGPPLATLSAEGAWFVGGDDADADADAPLTVELRDANPGALERVAGLPAGTIADWTRGAGDIRLTVRPSAEASAGEATLGFPGLEGVVIGRQRGERLDLEVADLIVRPAPERLAAFTNAADGRAPVRLTGDVDLTTTGRLTGVAFDDLEGANAGALLRAIESFQIDATTSPLTLVAAGVPSSMPRLAVGISRGAPGTPVRLTVRDAAADAATDASTPPAAAESRPSEDGTASTVAVDLRVRDLQSALAGDAFEPMATGLDGTLQLGQASSALLDALFGTGDLITSSIGARVDATLTAEDFGRDRGRLALQAIGTRGRVDGTVRGADGAFVVDESAPVVAVLDLHPVLQRKVLSNIQPIFAGVSSSDGPITLRVTSAIVPLADGASAATAEFAISGGTISMRPGFDFLSLVSLFDGGGEPIEATLEPVTGRLVAGRVITDGARLVFTKGASIEFAPGSSVDLETRTLDVRASMPLRWLGSVVREAQGLTDDITVPLVARGPAATAELKLDPSFDLAGALLEAGVGSLLERELERAVPGLGDLLRGLGGGGGRDRR